MSGGGDWKSTVKTHVSTIYPIRSEHQLVPRSRWNCGPHTEDTDFVKHDPAYRTAHQRPKV